MGKRPHSGGLYFVLEERLSEARFGLEEDGSASDGENSTALDTLTRDNLTPTIPVGGYVNGAAARGASTQTDSIWSESAAGVAWCGFNTRYGSSSMPRTCCRSPNSRRDLPAAKALGGASDAIPDA